MEETTKKVDNLLCNIHKLLIKYTKNNLKDYELTVPRFKTLWMVSKLQPVNMSKLNGEMYMANSTLTIIIDRLVDDAFLERYRNPEDRREVLVEMTEKGKEALEQLLEIRQGLLEEALEDLQDNQRENLITLLQPILQKLKEEL